MAIKRPMLNTDGEATMMGQKQPYEIMARQKAAEKAAQEKMLQRNKPKISMTKMGEVGKEGFINPAVQLQAGPEIQANQAAMEKLRGIALSEQESPWMKMQIEKQQMEEANQLGRAAQQAQGAQAAAESNLAMRGGLSGGARERLGQNFGEQLALGQSALRGQGMQQRLGMSAEDMKYKQNLLASMPSMEEAVAAGKRDERAYGTGVNQFNIGTRLGELGQQREFALKKYEEGMKGYAAERQAQATQDACFDGMTQVKMMSGEYKNIKDIRPGDRISLGGTVTGILVFVPSKTDVIYNYLGTFVSGAHFVHEFGKWTRVDNSKMAVMADRTCEYIYNLITEKNRIHTPSAVFWDYNDDKLAWMNKTSKVQDHGETRV